MALKQVDPMSMPDDSTMYGSDTPGTPPETLAGNFLDDLDPLHDGKNTVSSSSIPWPGSTYIIRSLDSGQVLTLSHGKVILTSPGMRDSSIYWKIVETKGWLGFRNPASGNYLGHTNDGWLMCKADRHQGWENFAVRPRPEGGYALLMTHYERLWHVGMKKERGVEKLAKLADGAEGGIAWEFILI